MTAISFPESVKAGIRQIAIERDYPLVLEIVNRGGEDELVLNSQEEAQSIVNVARWSALDALLKYPFWDEDSPRHDPTHEDAFQDVQMGIFEKTVMYISQEYKIVSSI